MNSKKVNRIFLAIILMHFAAVAVITVLARKYAFILDIVPNFIMSQSIILVPALLGVFISKENLPGLVGFHKIKVSSVFKIFLFTFLSMPLTSLINMISMLFVDNAVVAISGEVLEVPFLIMLFIIGIFGPFSEELVFRGIVYQGYKRTGTTLCAMVLSALLFALMHMNFNQAAYAFVIGLIVVMLVEATGSLWSSVIFHMFFNSQQVCLMYLYDAASIGGGGLESAEEILTTDMLLLAISVWLILAAVSTALAACVLVWIAKGENRENALRAIWKDRKCKKGISLPGKDDEVGGGDKIKENARQNRMITIPLLAAIVLALSYMSLEIILPRLLV